MTTRKREVFRTVTSNEYTEKAYRRLGLIQKYDRLIQATCPQQIVLETLGISERSIYRWKNKFKLDGLDGLEDRSRFPVLSIQVDGGSEFMSVFEQACAKKAIPLFVLPPYSPQLNGGVERCNGTFKYEFYKLNKRFKSQEELEGKLDKFTDFYNNIRPYQSLSLLTPCQFLEKLI